MFVATYTDVTLGSQFPEPVLNLQPALGSGILALARQGQTRRCYSLN